MMLLHRLKHGKLTEMVTFNKDIHNYNTMSKDDFHIRRVGTVAAGNFLSHKGVAVRVHNRLPIK